MPKTRKTVSPRKLAANRANARKSTGPRTPEGKARSALNALKHGLLADTVVIPDDPDESPEQLRRIRDALLAQFPGAGQLELILIERLTAIHWRLRRAYRFEVNSILDRREQCEAGLVQLVREAEAIASPYPPAQLATGHEFDMLLRYEAMLDRTLGRLTRQLLRLRADRQRQAIQSPPAEDGAPASSPPVDEPGPGPMEPCTDSPPYRPVECPDDDPPLCTSGASSRPSAEPPAPPPRRTRSASKRRDEANASFHVRLAWVHSIARCIAEAFDEPPSGHRNSFPSRPSARPPAFPPHPTRIRGNHPDETNPASLAGPEPFDSLASRVRAVYGMDPPAADPPSRPPPNPTEPTVLPPPAPEETAPPHGPAPPASLWRPCHERRTAT